MPETEKLTDKLEFSRRQFLKGTGIVIGGTAIGSAFLLSSCTGGNGETTKTVTKTAAGTTATATVTQTQTTTTTVAGVTKYVDPFTGQEFDTLAALKAHLEATMGAAPGVDNVTLMTVNGDAYGFVNLKGYNSLLYVLREKLGLFGTKNGCDMGECGACTVLINGKPALSCLSLALDLDGATIETVEGLWDGITLNPVQQIFYDKDALQCGYCAPGVIMSATALKREKASPTLAEIQEALSGHMCTCGNMGMYTTTLAGLR